MRGVVNGCIFMVALYAAVVLAFALPHGMCDSLTPLPWLRCHF